MAPWLPSSYTYGDYEILKKYDMLIIYMSQTIPIYYGAPEIHRQVPGAKTFIDAANLLDLNSL